MLGVGAPRPGEFVITVIFQFLSLNFLGFSAIFSNASWVSVRMAVIHQNPSILS